MKNLKVKGKLILCIVICLTLLTGCGKSELSSDFNEERVEAAAKEVISILNNKDTEAFKEFCNEQVREDLNDEILEEIYKGIYDAGEFIEIRNMEISGQNDKETQEDYAVASIRAQHEMIESFYTFTFNKDMKIVGFYYK